MQRWEYRVLPFDMVPTSEPGLTAWLNAAGAEGWEVVSIGTGPTIFKRPRAAPLGGYAG